MFSVHCTAHLTGLGLVFSASRLANFYMDPYHPVEKLVI